MKAKCLWMTGLSGAGKTTIAEKLINHIVGGVLLDGDVIRGTPLAKNVGFSVEDRREHIKRMGHIAQLVAKSGGVAVCSFISPEREVRDYVRSLFGEDEFIEIHISTPLEECERRDVKGLYKKARKGEIKDFTGISAPFEAPINPEITMDTTNMELQESVDTILEKIGYYGERSCFYIGRWNGAMHLGHEAIFNQSLEAGKKVTLLIRDVKPDEKNPWTAKEVKEMIDFRYAENPNVEAIIIPDLSGIYYGRGVGYEVSQIEVTQKIAGISGTECRKLIAEGDDKWKEFVHPRIAEFLEKKLNV